MEKRVLLPNAAPAAYKAMLALETYLATTKLTPIHAELIRIRASQINGCAYCLDMHTRDARKHGETEQRINVLPAWRDTPFFSEEEQVILALTEEVTLITHHVSDATYNNAARVLGDAYLGEVLMAIVTINAWNRISITTGLQPELR